MADDILKSLASKNKLLQLMHTKYPGYHPLMSILEIAMDENVEQDYRLRLDCHKTIANYVAPTLKSLEVQGEIDHNHSMLRVELASDLQGIPISYEAPEALEYQNIQTLEELNHEPVESVYSDGYPDSV